MTHLLVTNDFPPKIGGIQSYLWELWRRLEPSSFTVFTASSDPGWPAFDSAAADMGIRISRDPAGVLLPVPHVARAVGQRARATGAGLVVIDPVLPLGLIGPWFSRRGLPFAVVVHGAELTVPGRLPVARDLARRVMTHASLAICAGEYAASEVRRICGSRSPRMVVVPPGVDTERFHPAGTGTGAPGGTQAKAREVLDLPPGGPLVVSVSRLVPRKGMDVLVRASAALVGSFPDLTVAIAGGGRDEARLRRLVASAQAPVRMLGRVHDAMLPDLYRAADVFVMDCRDRWLGLEKEGFGIVFLEAAACGVPQVAGRSGGAPEAVSDGESGIVLDDPSDAGDLAAALRKLLSSPELRASMGATARRRAMDLYDYDRLSRRLGAALQEVEG